MSHTSILIRRFAAIAYDLLLLLSVLFVATALILPLNAGQAFDPQNWFYAIYLLIISFVFYGWFWTHGGQTLGLRAWKLQVLTFDHKKITWSQAFWRFIGAIIAWSALGFGFFWSLFDKNNRCWHDSLSKTAVFYNPTK